MPFDDYQLKRFSIQKYINEGWQVECWRLKYLIKKSHNDSFKKFEEYENSKKIVYRFNSFFELLKHMLKLKKNFFIYDPFFLTPRIFITCHLLKVIGGRIFFHDPADFVDVKFLNDKELRKQLRSLKKIDLIIKGLNFVKKYILKKVSFFLMPRIDLIFTNGIIGKKKYQNNFKFKKIIDLHTHDYDRFLNLESVKTQNIIKKDYILFLDQNYPIPYDNFFTRAKPVTSEKVYRESINNFFEILKKNFPEKEIIISLHPKSYSKNFNQYLSFKNKTPELVKNASLVVAHDSLSMQLAILWKKPLLLITTNDMQRSITKSRQIAWYSKELESDLTNIDDLDIEKLKKNIKEKLEKKDFSSYTNFINNHIKSIESPKKEGWKIISESLKEENL